MTAPPHDVIDFINAGSTAVVAVATVVLTWFAYLQIKHRADDRRDQARRGEAVARYHGLHMQRALRDAVTALDTLQKHTRHLDSWRQQATLAREFISTAQYRLEEMADAMIEQHSGTPAAIEAMLSTILTAYDAARELAGPVAPTMSDQEIIDLYATARKSSLVCLNNLETGLVLPTLPPQYQPTTAPGALGAQQTPSPDTF